MANALAGVGFLGAVGFFAGVNLWIYWRAYARLPTFDAYRRQHPELFKFGRCHCRRCGSGRLYVNSLDAFRRRHICTVCGETLYRS